MTIHLFFLVIMLLLCALFSGMEIAFVSSNKLRIELDRKQGQFPARIVAAFTHNPEQYLATMLVGNNIALVVYGLLMAILLEPAILHFTHSEATLLVVQTLLSTLLILIVAEFLPKALFRLNPNTFLNLFAIPVMFFYLLLYPITRLTILLANWALKTFFRTNIQERRKINVFGKIDLDNLVNEAQQMNQQFENESEIKIFQNALDFSSVRIRDCMIPRTEIEAVNVHTSLDELQERFIETGYSKILVYDGAIDNIVGYISSKDLFKNPAGIEERLVKPLIVPETMSAQKLLKMLMYEHKSIAVVVDEFGGTSGLITIEDILEEIFGEIEDEHDTIDLVDKQLSENEFLFSGRMEIEVINEKYGIGLPESDAYETLAGFILAHYQNLPKQNEKVVIDPFTFRILKVSHTRVELVRLSIHRD